ncbi:hypothetical protein [Cellulomonas sp.]|uniref:hypothetical protein n=1 Tax=Cellulomonas sp. TaxID=40001 RepID=UPI0025B7F7DA|nr:hypothetical protein [Cellulomonas sp.]
MAKTVFAPTIAAGQLISGIVYANTPQGQADRNMSFALTYMDNGGGWSGAWAALNVSFNPMYGAITAGFNAYDSSSAGNYGDGLVNAFTAIDITALTGASTLGALRAGGGTVGVAANSEAAAVNGVPKTSPNFKPPTNAPQSPPSEIPAGWRVREMPPTSDYPNGYWRLEKPMGNGGWQGIDPSTMKPGTKPETHVPFPGGN